MDIDSEKNRNVIKSGSRSASETSRSPRRNEDTHRSRKRSNIRHRDKKKSRKHSHSSRKRSRSREKRHKSSRRRRSRSTSGDRRHRRERSSSRARKRSRENGHRHRDKRSSRSSRFDEDSKHEDSKKRRTVDAISESSAISKQREHVHHTTPSRDVVKENGTPMANNVRANQEKKSTVLVESNHKIIEENLVDKQITRNDHSMDKQENINPIDGEEEVKDITEVNKKVAINVLSMKERLSKALEQARSAIAVMQQPGKTSSPSTPEVNRTKQDDPVVEALQNNINALADIGTTTEDVKDSVVITKSTESLIEKEDMMTEIPESTLIQPPKQDIEEFDMFDESAKLPSPTHETIQLVDVSTDYDAPQSNWDDPEGYYKSTIGEILDNRYRVMGNIGSGVFSTVVKCKVIKGEHEGKEVAIKLVRNNDTMRKAAQTEQRLLKELIEYDMDDKKCIVRLLRQFEHRNHIALVFEPMAMNLREALKKYGGKSGISIRAVRVFCKQMLIALHHMKTRKIVHADIKPDNILLNDAQNIVKLCDFGSAFKMDETDNDPTPYLVSRFYRAPEIILGLSYDYAVDIWSIGCCLFEMFTGKVLFPGSTNNEMLKYFMEMKGKVPNKIIRKHRSIYIEKFEMEPHFDNDLSFLSREIDRVTGKPITRTVGMIEPSKSLNSILQASKANKDDKKLVSDLSDLLNQIFMIDPMKRISAEEALKHPFVKGG